MCLGMVCFPQDWHLDQKKEVSGVETKRKPLKQNAERPAEIDSRREITLAIDEENFVRAVLSTIRDNP